MFGPPETLLFAFAFLRKAILGSSASNVYRTEVLRARPFPTDFGHAGDVGWGLRHCGEIRLGIVPEWFSKFVFHPRAKRIVEDSEAIRIQAARETLAHVRERIAPDVLRAAENLCVAWEHLFATKARRQGTSFWILRPGGWRARMAENGAEADLLLRRGEALALIEQSLRA